MPHRKIPRVRPLAPQRAPPASARESAGAGARTLAVRYRDIYAMVRRVPKGRVATYGQIAKLVGHCTARMVGYAMAAAPSPSRVPWHRIVNSQGGISVRAHGDGAQRQRELLQGEGVKFDRDGRLSLARYRWDPIAGGTPQGYMAE